MAKVHVGIAVALGLILAATPAFSQGDAPPPLAYPEPTPATGAPAAPAATPPAPGPAVPAQAPTMAAPPPAAPQAAPQVYQPPYQGPASASNPPSRDGQYGGQSGIVEPPAPPPNEPKGFELPDMSVRVDPLNWIIYGRLGLELEATLYKFVSLELVPVFVTDDQPPFMNLGSLPATLYQKSNGLGAMSGASIGAGFWLNGDPFRGTVLRLYYTNYGYKYTSKDDAGGIIDEASHTERHLVAYIGSHSRWGAFTIASGLGLGMELNRERRCVVAGTEGSITPQYSSNCTKDSFDFRLSRNPNVFDSLYGGLHPVYLTLRLSLGVVF